MWAVLLESQLLADLVRVLGRNLLFVAYVGAVYRRKAHGGCNARM